MDNTKPVYNGLHEQAVYLVDTSATSPALFVIKEFPTQLNAGKNLFKLHGHPRNLREDSSLYIEILDYNNEPIQHEIAELSEEDGSVVIVIYIYETTPPGNCTVTIVGEALYVDDVMVPFEWQHRSNVMWQRDVSVNSSKTNTAEIIFDTKPTITIQEQISVQLDRNYNTTQTIIYNTGSVQFISNNGTPTLIVNNGVFTPDMIGGTVTIPTPINPTPTSKYIAGSIPYTSIIDKVLSTSSILLRSAYLIDPSQSIYGHRYDNFDSSAYSITYESTPTYGSTENSESYALIEINDLQPISGDIARIKVFSNNLGTIGNWDLLSDVVLGDTEIFITDTGSIQPYIPIGTINANPDTYYQSSAFNGFNYIDEAPNLYYSSNDLTNGLHINTERNISAKNSVDVVRIRDQYAGKFIKGASYKFTLNAIGTRTIATGNTDPIISFYLSGSSFNTDYTDYFNQELPITVGKRIGYLQCKKDKQRFDDNTIIFNADSTGTAVLYYVIEGGQWEISDIHVTTNNTPGYTPEYTRIRTKIPTTHKSGVQQSFKVEYYNSQGVKSEHSTISDPIAWVGGNHYIDGDHNLVTGSLFIADKLATGIEFSGRKNSGMIRTTGYTGFNDKNKGILIWSGSALTGSTTDYKGTGVELYASDDNYFRFATDPSETSSLYVKTETFFLGNTTSSISSNGGNIQISGSVTFVGTVTVPTASYALTASYFSGSISNAIYAQTASYLSGSISNAIYADTASYYLETDPIFTAKSGSLATTGSNIFSGSQTITGSLTVSGSSRVIGTLNADGVQNIRQYNTNTNFFGGNLAIGEIKSPNTTLDVTGNANITGSLNVTSGITASLFGTASWSSNAITASYITTSQTASYVLNAVSSSQSTNSLTASYVVTAQTASYFFTSSVASSSFSTNSVSSSLAQTASYVLNAVSASYSTNSLTASYIANVVSSSYAITASYSVLSTTASYAQIANTSSYTVSSSFATTSNTASYVMPLIQYVQITGSLNNGYWSKSIGLYSHAEGHRTTAIGDYSHAEGWSPNSDATPNIAYGYASHTEGMQTNTYGTGSHAEGYQTTAYGDYSHAEGEDTIARGTGSHAEGHYTTTYGDYSHAEGYKTVASGSWSHSEGNQTNASGSYSHTEGSYTTASGDYSHAEGHRTTAIGDYSHAEGYQTTASGSYSHAEGNSTLAIGGVSHAEGQYTTTYGDYSHAEGEDTIARGFGSHAEGQYTISSGSHSHAEGDGTVTYGYASHAEGFNTIASGYTSHAEGYLTISSGDYSHAEGDGTVTYGFGSHAEGQYTISSGSYSHAEGDGTVTYGDYSHAEGVSTTTYGDYSHAEGYLTIASGSTSHSEGDQTTAIGVASHAEGVSTVTYGYASHAEGVSTVTYGDYSHAEGVSTTTYGDYSHAEGFNTVASGSYQHVQGQYNLSSSFAGAFIIGNGVSSGIRSNLVFASGSTFQVTGSVIATAGITGSFSGNGSGLTGITSAANIANTDLTFTANTTRVLSHSGNTSRFIISGSDTSELPVLDINSPTLGQGRLLRMQQQLNGESNRTVIRSMTAGGDSKDDFSNFSGWATDSTFELVSGSAVAPNQLNGFQWTSYTGTSYRNLLNLSSSGNVGLGTQTPAYQLQLSTDSAGKPSTNTWTITSDSRIKENIIEADYTVCYDIVKNLPLKRYTWKQEAYTNEQVPDRSKLGWIAQDVETVFPKAVEIHAFSGSGDFYIDDCKSLNSDQIYAAMYGTIKKLISDNESLKLELQSIKTHLGL